MDVQAGWSEVQSASSSVSAKLKGAAFNDPLLEGCLRLGAIFREQRRVPNSPNVEYSTRRLADSQQIVHDSSAASKDTNSASNEGATGSEDKLVIEELPPTEFTAQGCWEYHCGIRLRWVEVDAEEDKILKTAFLRSGNSPKIGPYLVNSVPYEVDFSTMRRKNLATGKERHVRFSGQLPFAPPARQKPAAKPKPVPETSSARPRSESPQTDGYTEPSSLYSVDDKGEYVYIWLKVEIGDMVRRANAGHVEVDIKPRGIEARILDMESTRTLEYRWVHLREINPANSSWRAAMDGDRLVICLAKSSHKGRPWSHLFEDPDTSKRYFRSSVSEWPEPLDRVQGCWRIEVAGEEEEEPSMVRIFGPNVIISTPDGAQRFKLQIDRGALIINEAGESFHGKVARTGGRIDWDDGLVWVRDKAADAALETGSESPPVASTSMEEQATGWAMRTELASVGLLVELASCGQEDLFGQQQRGLLEMLADEDEDDSEAAARELLLTVQQPLPAELLSRVRICSMDAQEFAPQAVPLTLARLQRKQPLADATEVAAITALDLLLRWLFEFVAPAQRQTLRMTLDRLQTLLEDARLRQNKNCSNMEIGSQKDTRKCPPSWWVSIQEPPLARVACRLLRDELQALRPSGLLHGAQGELPLEQAFATARASVVGQIWANSHPLQRSPCKRHETAGARRYAAAVLEQLCEPDVWRGFSESGILVLNQSVDWTTLLVARREAQAWFEESGDAQVEVGSIDLLQKGHRCMYGCARLCRMALAQAEVVELRRIAGMAPGDGFAFLERQLTREEEEEEDEEPCAYLFLAAPDEPAAEWEVPLAIGTFTRLVRPVGGMLLISLHRPRFVKELLNTTAEEEPPWLRVSLAV